MRAPPQPNQLRLGAHASCVLPPTKSVTPGSARILRAPLKPNQLNKDFEYPSASLIVKSPLKYRLGSLLALAFSEETWIRPAPVFISFSPV
jgi:hypothetical protein